MELVFEIYGPVKEWPDNLKIRIAHALGYCGLNPDEDEKKTGLEKLEQREKEEIRKEEKLDLEYDRSGAKDALSQSCIREDVREKTFSVNLSQEKEISTEKR